MATHGASVLFGMRRLDLKHLCALYIISTIAAAVPSVAAHLRVDIFGIERLVGWGRLGMVASTVHALLLAVRGG